MTRRNRQFQIGVLELESRLVPANAGAGHSLLAAAPDVHLAPHHASVLPGGASAPGGGYSPSQIRQAYGFDQITFSNGTIQGDGTGQTIAIIDAYDQPNIASDLAAFDSALGIAAPPKFTKVNQNGGNSYPAADTGWGLEISLDVEWAHAIAPGANILLVEASSTSWTDLFSAVDYARHSSGVSVVSMSFGSGEWSGEAAYDSYFTTPSGHNGVSFVASTGDSGSASAPEYASASPNVLAVGGTQLSVDSSGNYSSEVGWSGSGGGISADESQPSYQKGVVTQTSSARGVPDVAYNGSSNSPFGIYDTSGYGGWLQVYGTSAGAPQWAALIAIADQGLALSGKGTLDGGTQTLPKLYQLSSNDFHDITSGSNGAYSAGTGYDLVTGRGTPVANLVVADLVGSSGSTNPPPTVATPASASPAVITGTTTSLSVLGADNSGEASLTYTWSATSRPTGAAAPSFSANGTNAAKNATATFSQAGSYTFLVTIADSANLTVTSSASVTVTQTLTGVAVTPGSATVANGASKQFTASAVDQFGQAMASQPSFAWSMPSGVGTLSGTGMYTAPGSGTGSAVIQAVGGGLTGTASVTVASLPAAPTNLTAKAVSTRQVNLAWQDSAGDETGFIIQRSSNGSSWTKIGQVGAGVTSFTDTTVSKRKTYYYRVYAFNGTGNSGYSNTATVVTPSTQPALSTQANVTNAVAIGQSGATPSNVVGTNAIDLFWNTLADQTGGDAARLKEVDVLSVV